MAACGWPSSRQAWARSSSASGLGALLADRLGGLGPAILAFGITVHAWSMVDKHRHERSQGVVDPWWATALYWACWIGLAGLLAWIVIRS